MKDIVVDYSKLVSSTESTASFQGMYTKVSLLGSVCTARMLYGFFGSKEEIEREISFWLKVLRDPRAYEQTRGLGCSYVFFRPQMVIAVTNRTQWYANEALIEAGFTPSQPVKNLKYGTGSELINWTYALHGFLETDEKADICVV
tara:strand:- start:44861 stop:45295 length:435 start_codon:yes stop_codon:yes gene_type:complete